MLSGKDIDPNNSFLEHIRNSVPCLRLRGAELGSEYLLSFWPLALLYMEGQNRFSFNSPSIFAEIIGLGPKKIGVSINRIMLRVKVLKHSFTF